MVCGEDVKMIIFLLGILDLIAGILLILSPTIFIPYLVKTVGIALIVKGIWSIATGFAGS